MPGRPGRSKGCFKCRQRHIKCDETRPTCLRCQKARLACPGYPQTEFVDESSVFWKRNGSPSSQLQPAFPIPSPSIFLPVEPSSPMGQDVCLNFLCDAFALWERNQPDFFPNWGHWPGFRALYLPDALPKLSLQAFSLSFFGRLMNAESARLAGSQSYGQALSQLKGYLHTPSDEQMISIVVAITIFKLYEFLIATSRSAWQDHALGLAALFEAIGPSFFATADTLQLLEGNRYVMILACITTRQASFLAKRSWKVIPYATNNLAKDDQQVFLDIMADMTLISLHWGELQGNHSPTQRSNQEQELRLEIVDAAERLQDWKLGWDVKHGKDMWDGPPAPADMCLPQTQTLYFKTAQLGYEFIHWSAAIITLLEIAEALRMPTVFPEKDGFDMSATSGPDETQVMRLRYEHAVGICSAIPFFVAKLGNMLIRLDIQYPIRMAWRTMRYHDKQIAQWLENLAGLLSSDQGWQVGKHLLRDFAYSPQRLVTMAPQTPEQFYNS